MADLEDRLRAAVTRLTDDFLPSDDLPERINARVRRRRRQRKLVAAVATTSMAGLLAAVLVWTDPSSDEGGLQMGGDDDRVSTDDSTTTTERDRSTTSTTDSDSAAGSDSSARSGSVADSDSSATTSSSGNATSSPNGSPPPPPAPGVQADTPLNHYGIGPIRAGMTVAEAEAVAGVTFTNYEPIADTSTCNQQQIVGLEEFGIWFMIQLSGNPAADSRNGVIRAVSGTRTAEGVAVGDYGSLETTYGPPTRTSENPDYPGGQILEWGLDGFGIVAFTDGEKVVALRSGDLDWAAARKGCA